MRSSAGQKEAGIQEHGLSRSNVSRTLSFATISVPLCVSPSWYPKRPSDKRDVQNLRE